MYSMWIALKKVPIAEKSVASIKDQREYCVFLVLLGKMMLQISLDCSEKVPKFWHYMMVQTMLHTSMTIAIYV